MTWSTMEYADHIEMAHERELPSGGFTHRQLQLMHTQMHDQDDGGLDQYGHTHRRT